MERKMEDRMPRNALLIAGRVSKRTGIPLDDIVQYYVKKRRIIAQERQPLEGKYAVWGIDLFDENYWIAARGSTGEEVAQIARRMTDEAESISRSDRNMTMVYCAYDPK